MMEQTIIISSLVIGLLFVFYLLWFIIRKDKGNKEMILIYEKIKSGATTFLIKEYKNIFIYIIVVFIFLFFFFDKPETKINEGLIIAVAFLYGALSSMFAGFVGMKISTESNVRTASAAHKSLKDALRIALSSGMVMGLVTALLGLFGVFVTYTITKDISFLFGFGFGASSVALFARVGGGIFTKSADLAADLVGKFEYGIDEDDPRNPAVIADNVGDNVGDVAGMGADLFESYVGSLIAAMSIGAASMKTLVFPLIVAAIGIFSSLIGFFFVKGKNVDKALLNGIYIANVVNLILIWIIYKILLMKDYGINLYFSIVVGALVGVLIGLLTNYYTATHTKHAKKLAEVSKEGIANNILSGIAIGMKSSATIIILISLAVILAYLFGKIYGIAIAGVAMLSTLALSLGIDAFGPVVDNAGGIAEMAKLPKKIREITDELDSAGNTTAAIGKGFAIGSASLTSLALLTSLAHVLKVNSVNLVSAAGIIGLFIGASLPFLFSAMTLQSVNKVAKKLINEVHRQLSDKAIIEGKKEPDYNKAIAIATQHAIKEMILPALLVIVTPIAVGFIFGVKMLIAMLAGALVTGAMLGLTLSNAGGVWDNAKKLIESGVFGGKNSSAHKAAVIGDTVGDPFKDTSGPALNILIKLMTIVSLVIAPLLIRYGSLIRII